jgi:hypothetical protein
MNPLDLALPKGPLTLQLFSTSIDIISFVSLTALQAFQQENKPRLSSLKLLEVYQRQSLNNIHHPGYFHYQD